MVDELISKKDEITQKQAEMLLESYERMAKTVENALKEHKTGGKGGANILSTLTVVFSINRNATLGMTGGEKLEYAKMEYVSRKDAFDAIKEKLKSGEKSVFKSIDEQLEICKRKIEKIDRELEIESDPNKREELIRTRNEYNNREFEK